MLFINRLAKVADDPIVQGADPVNIIRVGSHEDCRNRAPTALWVIIGISARNVRYWHLADIPGRAIDVRFRGTSGHHADQNRICFWSVIEAQRGLRPQIYPRSASSQGRGT